MEQLKNVKDFIEEWKVIEELLIVKFRPFYIDISGYSSELADKVLSEIKREGFIAEINLNKTKIKVY